MPARKYEKHITSGRHQEFCHKVLSLKTSHGSEQHPTPRKSGWLFGLLKNINSFPRRANIRQLTYITLPELRFSGIPSAGEAVELLRGLGITSARLEPGTNEREMQPPSLQNW
jgi:hypothetical protein